MVRKPIEERGFRYKNPVFYFFCPLCNSKRALLVSAKIDRVNIFQIFLIVCVLSLLTFELMGLKVVLVWPLVVWPIFELIKKWVFRRQIPCPHCGFDATWYKRDVRQARKIVDSFWIKKKSESNPVEDLPSNAETQIN